MTSDPAFEEWLIKARRADVLAVAMRLPGGKHLSKRACVNVPCPGCGGTDRFSVNTKKNIFFCRLSGSAGDAIALAQHAMGSTFLEAVEWVTGEPPPGRTLSEEDRRARRERLARMEAERAAERSRREAEDNQFRAKEVRRAHDIWSAGVPIAGTAAELYLARRGVVAPPEAHLRFAAQEKYWHFIDGEFRLVHEGPAMLARISGPDGAFLGCHRTFIDLAQPKGKAVIAHPQTGEILEAKKVRGSKKGGHILLAGRGKGLRLVVGEGIETVLTVHNALAAGGVTLADTWFWTSVDLGNLGGRALDKVRHPSRTLTDARGRVRAAQVPGPTPDPADTVMLAPGSVTEMILLGDGDSDRVFTENVLIRAAHRNRRLGRTIRWAWAAPGKDFGDMGHNQQEESVHEHFY